MSARDPLGILAALDGIRWRVGDVIAPQGNQEARLTLLAPAKGGWYVRQMNGRRARYSIDELMRGKYDKVRP
ncbi:MAG: hypothetical protein KGL39_07250 [Patescibacteria group bacterium]|nr:hypothetical protein [Patescibacteria group bacterium]